MMFMKKLVSLFLISMLLVASSLGEVATDTSLTATDTSLESVSDEIMVTPSSSASTTKIPTIPAGTLTA